MKLLVTLLLFAAGCARSPVRGDIHQRGWLLVETSHIALRTDLGRDDAVAHARDLEESWNALAHLYDLVAPGSPAPDQPFRVVHLASCSDFERIHSDAAGFVFPSADGNLAVTCAERGGTTLVHELAHIFNHHHLPRIPVWVEEGLATYYSTLEVDDGRAVLGNFPTGLSYHWNRPRFLPNLATIRRMDRDGFYDPNSKDRNYFCAWKLVHLLNNTTPDRQRRFRAYLAALAGGAGNDQAWLNAFGDDTSDLASDYVNYQRRDRVNRLVTGYRSPGARPPRIRRLRPGEVHVLWAVLLTVEHEDLVAAQLDRAREADPAWPELLYWRAVLLRPPDAIQLLRRYLAGGEEGAPAPGDPGRLRARSAQRRAAGRPRRDAGRRSQAHRARRRQRHAEQRRLVLRAPPEPERRAQLRAACRPGRSVLRRLLGHPRPPLLPGGQGRSRRRVAGARDRRLLGARTAGGDRAAAPVSGRAQAQTASRVSALTASATSDSSERRSRRTPRWISAR